MWILTKKLNLIKKILGGGGGGGGGGPGRAGPGTETKTTDCVKWGKYENATIYTM